MTQRFTYDSMYTEFLVPGYSNLKVTVTDTGNVYIDDMNENHCIVYCDSAKSHDLYDLKAKVEELEGNVAFWKKNSDLWKWLCSRKVEDLRVKAANAEKLEKAYLREVERSDRLSRWLNASDKHLSAIADVIETWTAEAEDDDFEGERIEQ